MNETIRLILTSIGAAAVGALATVWTGAFGYWNTDRSQDIQMVNIALSILGGEIKDQDKSEPGRRFALRLLQKYAEVEIPVTEFNNWAKSGTLPPDIYLPSSQDAEAVRKEAIRNLEEAQQTLFLQELTNKVGE